MPARALVIVDVQNDFLPGGALAVPRGDEVLGPINAAQRHFDLVVSTQDWHPAQHVSFAGSHCGRRVHERIPLAHGEQVLWPAHCVQGTPGAELSRELESERVAHRVRKGMDPECDCYSAFADARHRSTGLAEFLRSAGVSDVYLAGLATDYCVLASALDALRLGFRVWILEDACRGVEVRPGDSAAALETARRAGARVISSRDL